VTPIHIGRYDQYVSLDAMAASADGDGGHTLSATPLSPANDWAWIAPATPIGAPLTPGNASVQERSVKNTIESLGSVVVRMRYRSDVNARTRIPAGSRVLYVRSVHNPDSANEEIVCACQERLS